MTNYAYDMENQNPVEGSSPLFPVKKDGKWGYIDQKGKIVINHQFDHADDFHEGAAVVRMDIGNEKSYGNDARDAGSFSDLLTFKHGKHKFGFIDMSGRYLVRPEYDYADRFSEGLAMVRVGDEETGLYGYINRTGEVAIKPQFPYGGFTRNDLNFSEGLAPTRINGKFAFINNTGSIAFQTDYDHAWGFSEGLAAVRIGDMRSGKYGYIDKSGKTVISPLFRAAMPFHDGLAGVRLDGMARHIWGYIGKSGLVDIYQKYDDLCNFHNGLARTWTSDLISSFLAVTSSVAYDPHISGTIRYISPDGSTVLKLRNGSSGDFHEGLAVRQLGGEYFYIDKSGNIAINSHFNYAKDFVNGLAMVQVDQKWGYIDKSGKFVWEPSE